MDMIQNLIPGGNEAVGELLFQGGHDVAQGFMRFEIVDLGEDRAVEDEVIGLDMVKEQATRF